MAGWRKISRDLAISERFNNLSERARLVYFQAYPFADRDGLLPGSSTKLMAMAFPIAGIAPGHLEGAAVELVEARLWESLCDAGGRPVYRIQRFVEYQGSGHLAREAPSKFISPLTTRSISIDFDALAGELPSEERRGEERSREERESTRARISEEDAGNGKESAPTCHPPSNRNDATYLRPTVLAAMARALGEEEFIPSPVDGSALIRFAGPIGRCSDLDAFLCWGVAQLREKKAVREHWLADVLPLLNDYKPSRIAKTSGLAPATVTPAWIEEARKIAPEYFASREEKS